MKQEELDIILENHEKWLWGKGGKKADLSNTELKNTNLRLINLKLADLSNADLRGANLRGANLSNADLRGADLRGADLSNTGLRDASLKDADLSNACLRGANLSNAYLNWVNWQQVGGLTTIIVQVDTSRQNNQIAYIKELDIWITGCFQGTLAKLKESIEKTHRHNEKLKKRYYRAIDFILKEVAE
ncbi:pentapeptide repeat-containing protein [Listeria monocytogenes]|nr:pentapeptide repeat-containing protein [Listeria monocytogenes]EGN7538205.1 pentapeptide repeat-containing protein [Listeria monocytogenes]EIR0575497.1 pentapeptide repeat-containing protein [Listeria monocytogenes]